MRGYKPTLISTVLVSTVLIESFDWANGLRRTCSLRALERGVRFAGMSNHSPLWPKLGLASQLCQSRTLGPA